MKNRTQFHMCVSICAQLITENKSIKNDGVSKIILNFATSKKKPGIHCLLSALQN